MADEEFSCDECGKNFDSHRGLKVHQSQIHDGENESSNQETGTGTGSNPSPRNISIGVRQALIAVFVFGLAIGFSAGMISSNVQNLTGSMDAVNPDDGSDNPSGSDSQISGESTMAAIKDIGEAVGVDGNQLESCTNSAGTEEINQDRREITDAVGSIGTPTFMIGNSQIGYAQVTGAQPYSRMRSTINQKVQEARQGDQTVGEDEYTLENISFEGEPVMGDENAPINIIEYSDYGCPWCAEWHGVDAIPQRNIDREESFSKVRSNHVETGEVQFIAKDYPVPQLHPDATTAHKAANCVLENSPDSFWEFSQKLYEERDKWKR